MSLVGAGGKTSAMFVSAKQLSAKGFKVLVTTTTAIMHPEYAGFFYHKLAMGRPCNQISPCKGQIIVGADSLVYHTLKLKGFAPEYIDELNNSSMFDYIIVEADGSKNRPVKAPARHEPVIPDCTKLIVGVIGLDCLKKPLSEDYVHRPEYLSKLTGFSSSSLISQETLASLVLSRRYGLFKNAPENSRKIVLLNKADRKEIVQEGILLGKKIRSKGNYIERVVVSSLLDPNPVKAVI